MELDALKKTIQDFFCDDTVTIVGSGLSSAEGIPGMTDLSTELQKKIPSELLDKLDLEIWEKISGDLKNGISLEKALQRNKPSGFIEECIRIATAEFIGKAESEVFEKVVGNQQILRFEEYLNQFNIRNNGLTVITTNYDRLIEYACEHQGVSIDTLFAGKFFAKFLPEQSKYAFCSNIIKRGKRVVPEFAPKVTVLKPHGCLSWHMIDNEPFSIPGYSMKDCLIITPGINKYKEGYNVPFDTHRNKANDAIDSAQRYIIIGYGFSDDHLETHLVQQLKGGKPALILSRSLSPAAKAVVTSSKRVTAICKSRTDDSSVITAEEECAFPNINLWDLHTMLKEVF